MISSATGVAAIVKEVETDLQQAQLLGADQFQGSGWIYVAQPRSAHQTIDGLESEDRNDGDDGGGELFSTAEPAPDQVRSLVESLVA